jgi:hypothetical protein
LTPLERGQEVGRVEGGQATRLEVREAGWDEGGEVRLGTVEGLDHFLGGQVGEEVAEHRSDDDQEEDARVVVGTAFDKVLSLGDHLVFGLTLLGRLDRHLLAGGRLGSAFFAHRNNEIKRIDCS